MTIQEAIRSGKKFRRHSQTHLGWYSCGHTGGLGAFTKEDVLAEDWEIELEKIVITREQLEAAWDYTFELGESVSKGMQPSINSAFFKIFSRRLGFKS